MTDNPETFRQGAGALRNARDWAKEKREELINVANGKALNAEPSGSYSSGHSFVSLPLTECVQLESETSADELALDPDTFASSSHRIPIGAQSNPPPEVSSNRRPKKASQVNTRHSRRPEASHVI